VEALAQLGAKEVLLEYLSQKREIPDAVARFGEEAVENTAARALSKWRTDNVYLFLKDYAQKRMLSGVIEALGKFERRKVQRSSFVRLRTTCAGPRQRRHFAWSRRK